MHERADLRDVDEEAWRKVARACGLNEGLLMRDISGYAERVLRCVDAVRERAIAEGWHRPIIDQVVTIAKQRAAQLVQVAPAAPAATAFAPAHTLDRSILYGRVYPYIYNPSIGGAESGLAVRVAYAVAVAGIDAIRLGSSEQAAFEQAVGDSSIERWVNEVANTEAPPAWRATDPTRSSVVTVRRPAVPLMVDGWSVEARASVSTSPFGISTEAPVLLFVADVVLRPNDSAAAVGRPLAPEDLFRLLWFLTTAAIEQVAPRAVESLPGRPALRPVAFDALVTASGRPLSEFTPLEWFGKSRAEGALDASGGEWPVDSFDTLADREQRATEIRSWIESLHRESGWSGHEPGIAALPIPEE